MAWNTGSACAPITLPHISRPPYHTERAQQIQTRFVKVIGFGNATEPENNNHRRECRSQTKTPGRTGGVQDEDWIVRTFEFKFGKILKVLGIVVWEQVFEGWHQLDDRDFRPLFLQNSNCRICKWLEVRRDQDILAPRLIDEVGNSSGRIPGRNREGDTFCTDDPELGGGIRDRV